MILVGWLHVDWLTSTFISLHNGGDGVNCGSYRPESLTSIRLKTLERALRDKIVNVLEASKLTMIEQHGLRHSH